MLETIAKLIVNAWLLIGEFAWVWLVFMAVFVPVWMVLLLRRLTRIARAFEAPPSPAGVFSELANAKAAERHKEISIATPGHQLLR